MTSARLVQNTNFARSTGSSYTRIHPGCFFRPFMLTPACYSVGRFDASPGENTWNAIKPVVGLVCASCEPPLVNTTVGCTQVHWLDGEEERGEIHCKRCWLQQFCQLCQLVHILQLSVGRGCIWLVCLYAHFVSGVIVRLWRCCVDIYHRQAAVCTSKVGAVWR